MISLNLSDEQTEQLGYQNQALVGNIYQKTAWQGILTNPKHKWMSRKHSKFPDPGSIKSHMGQNRGKATGLLTAPKLSTGTFQQAQCVSLRIATKTGRGPHKTQFGCAF